MTVGEARTWDQWAHTVYLVEVARQARFALTSLAKVREVTASDEDATLWLLLQGFFTTTGNVSKLLRPPSRQRRREEDAELYRRLEDWKKVRGSKLCELLEVDDSSPVLDRSVRDACEHFDERLDRWTLDNVAPTVEQVESGQQPEAALQPHRFIDQHKLTAYVGETWIDLRAVGDELDRILQRASELEPRVNFGHPDIAYLISGWAPIPPELTLFAPSGRPDEPVTAGVTVLEGPTLEDVISHVWRTYHNGSESTGKQDGASSS